VYSHGIRRDQTCRAVVAQVSTFDLSGAVLDQSSAVLPGVTVSLKNTKTGLVRTEVTDERGRDHFIALPVVGEYNVKVELSGFAAEECAGLMFRARGRPHARRVQSGRYNEEFRVIQTAWSRAASETFR
jgi:hypothetical protein